MASFFMNNNKFEDGGKKAGRKSYLSEVKRKERSAKKNDRGDGNLIVRHVGPERQLQETFTHCEESRLNKDAKRRARVHYAERHKYDLPVGVGHLSEISPFLDVVQTPDMTLESRLEHYSKRHKCRHGFAFNKISFIRENQKVIRFLKVSCDHQHDSFANDECICPRCHSAKTMHVERTCGCRGIACSRCHYVSYRRNNRWSIISCSCVTALTYELKEMELGHSIRKKNSFDELAYDHTLESSSIEQFLGKYVKTKVNKVSEDRTYAGVTKKADTLKEFLSKNLPPVPVSEDDFPKMIPEGVAASSMYNAVAGGIQASIRTVLDTVKSFADAIFDFLTGHLKNRLEGVAEVLSTIGSLFTACYDWMQEMPITELVLLITALFGSTTQSNIAIATIIIGIGSRFVRSVECIRSKWPGEIAKILSGTVGYFAKKSAHVVMVDSNTRKRIAELSSELAKTVPTQTFNNWARLPSGYSHPAYVALRQTMTDSEIYNNIQYYRSMEGKMEPQGILDFLTIAVSAFPLSTQPGLFKSLSLFCKDILPVIMVTKNIASLGGKIWNWLKRMFGFCTTDTKTWVQMELQIADSPVRTAVFSALDYKVKALGDLPDARASMTAAKKALDEMVTYIKEENRLDVVTLRLISDTEKIVSTTTCPPYGRKGEPFCVRLYGPPGTGKSRTAPFLFAPILGAKTQEEFYAKTFMRNMQEYWDGVGTRQCIMYDDFGQNRAEPMDLMELILLISAAPFMANFANISGNTPKGMSIDPKLVIACSNVEVDYTTQIADVDAIYRRFHLRIETKLNDKGETLYCVRGGSITGQSETGGRRLVPITDWMDMDATRDYIFYAYQIFLYDRSEGRDKMGAKFDYQHKHEIAGVSIPTKCPLVYDETGRAEAAPTMPLANAQASIMKFARPSVLDKPKVTETYTHPLTPPERKMLPEYVLSFGELFDVFLSQTSFNFFVFLLGVNVCSAWQCIKNFDAGDILGSYKQLIVPVATALCTAIITYMVLARDSDMQPESNISKNKVSHRHYMPEGLSESVAVQTVQNVLQKATCILTRVDSTGRTYSSNAILVGGMYLMTVEHVFVPGFVDSEALYIDGEYQKFMPEGTKYYLKVPTIDNTLEFNFERKRLTVLQKFDDSLKKKVDVDCVLYDLPRIMPMQKHIFNRFWDGDFSLSEKKGLMLEYNSKTMMQTWRETTFKKSDVLFHDQNGRRWRQNIVYATHGSHPGACGGPVMLADGTSNSPVVGIHIGYYQELDLACVLVLTKDLIADVVRQTMDTPRVASSFTAPITMQPEMMASSVLSGTGLQLVGETTRKIYEPTKTTLRRSLVHDKIQKHYTEPSVLSNTDPRIPDNLKGKVDLYRDGIMKMKRQIDVSYEDLAEVRAEMIESYKHLNWKNFGKTKSFMSMFEALNPSTVLKSIDMSTSPGFPFTLLGLKRTDLFQREPNDSLIMTEVFLQQLYEDLLDVAENRVPQWFVVGALKDERRPIEKVRLTPKTRLFTVCPIVQILLEKRYFSRFMELVMTERKVPYAGGVDRLGKSWHDMFMQLREVSDVGFGGDYERYDGSVSEGLLRSASEIMMSVLDEKCLDKEFQIHYSETVANRKCKYLVDQINNLRLKERKVLEAVRIQLFNPTYIIRGKVFRANGSLTSGCWTTQLAGSLANEMLLRSGWNALVPAHIRGGYHFSRFVRSKIMGDDNINAVERTATKWFNAETYAKWLETKGMIYTSADKKGKAIAVENLSDISFLKNKTGIYYGYYAPQMDFAAAVEPVNWVRESKHVTPLSALEMNANGTLRALFFYGPQVFNSVRRQLINEQPDLDLVDFNTLHHQYLEYGTFPGTQPEEMAFYEQVGVVPKEPVKYSQTGMAEPLAGNATIFEINNADLAEISLMTDFDPKKENNNDETTDFFKTVNNPYSCLPDKLPGVPERRDGEPGFEGGAYAGDDKTINPQDEKRDDEPSKKMVPEMQVDDIGNWRCTICRNGMTFSSRNRAIDHMILDHQVDGTWEGAKTALQFLQVISIKEARELYSQLSGTKPRTPMGLAFIDLICKEKIPSTMALSSLNDMINWSRGATSAVTQRSMQSSGSINIYKIVHGTAYHGAVHSSLNPVRTVDVERICAQIRNLLEDEEGYEVIPEHKFVKNPKTIVTHYDSEGNVIRKMTPEMDADAQATIPNPIPTEEAPLVTNPDVQTDLKDPTGEERTAENREGTILSDKSVIDHVPVKGSEFVSPRAERTLNDQAWNLMQMLEKWHPVEDVQWTVSDPREAVLFEADLILEIIKSAFAGAAFSVFKDFRCAGIKIKAVMVASKWHQGRVCVGYSPSMVPRQTGAYPRKVTTKDLIEIGCIKLDPSQGGTSEYYIPFRHPKSYLTLEEKDSLGQLLVMVHSPLQVVNAASQSVVVKLFFCLDKPVFKVPKASSLTFAQMQAVQREFAKTTIAARPVSTFRTKKMTPEMAVNAQPTINEYPREGIPIAAKRAMTGDPKVSHFGEKETNLLNIGKKYRRIAAYGNSSTTDATFWQKIPLEIVYQQFWILSMFNAIRGALNFKIFHDVGNFQTGVAYRGTIEVFYEPQPDHTDARYQAAFSADFDPHRMLASSNEGCLEFQIPFLQRSAIVLNPMWYKTNFQSTGPYLPRGNLWLKINPLSTPGANTRYLHRIDVFASLSDEFGVGIFRGVPGCKLDNGFPGWNTARQEEEREEKKMIPQMLEELVGGALKTIAEKVVPEKVVTTALSILDKPAVSTTPNFVTQKRSGFLNFCVGPEPVDKLTLHPARQQLVDSEHFGSTRKNADYDDLFSRASHIGHFTWKVDHQSGDLLQKFDIGPTMDVALNGFPLRPSIMCYMASKFKYWRGGITLIFEVVGTNFHEGRLDFSYHPNSGVVPADYETRVSQYTVSCAVKNTENKFPITCPYLGEEPYRRVNTGQATNEADATASPPCYSEFYSGVLGVSVGAPLRVPDGVPNNVEVEVYVLPASDFELLELTMDGRSMMDENEI